jgi:restriction endonuclease S subunit
MSGSGTAGWISKYPTKIWASDCFSIEINNNNINNFDNQYIYYYLKLNQSLFLKKEIDGGYQKGQAQPHVYPSDVNNFLIPNISIEKQQEIVIYLDNIYKNANIENTTKYMKDYPIINVLLNNYNDFDKIIWFQDAIQRLENDIEHILLQKKWNIQSLFNKYRDLIEVKKFGEYVKFDIGGTPSTTEPSYWDGDKLWVTIKELNNNVIDDTTKKITQNGIKNSPVKLIKKGSILVSFKLSFGKVGIAGKNMYCNEAIMFFKHENEITNKYLYVYFQNIDFSKGLTNGNIGSGSLNKTSLYNLQIPIPPLNIQQQIITEIENIISAQSSYVKYAETLQEQINIIYTIIDNMTKQPIPKQTTQKLVNMCDVFMFGTNMENISTKKTKFKTPYYTTEGIMYCDKFTYNGKFIICDVTDPKNYIYYIKNGPFSASKDIILIELKPEFSDNFDYIYNYIKNNFKYDINNKKSAAYQLQHFEIEDEIKEDIFNEYILDNICDVINIGQTIETTNETKNKKCSIPYYTENGMIYCDTNTFEGQYILCTRTEPNKGELFKVDNKFSANKNMIVIKLKEKYNEKFDDIYEYIKNNFDFEKMIKEYPILVEINGKKTPTTNISKFHLKKFIVKLKL